MTFGVQFMKCVWPKCMKYNTTCYTACAGALLYIKSTLEVYSKLDFVIFFATAVMITNERHNNIILNH